MAELIQEPGKLLPYLKDGEEKRLMGRRLDGRWVEICLGGNGLVFLDLLNKEEDKEVVAGLDLDAKQARLLGEALLLAARRAELFGLRMKDRPRRKVKN